MNFMVKLLLLCYILHNASAIYISIEIEVLVESNRSETTTYKGNLSEVVYHIPEDDGAVPCEEDKEFNFTQMAFQFGYDCEEYDVITTDGYILKVFHIPGDKDKTVLLPHGFFDTSDSYILRGNRSLAVALAQNGYDAWYLNARGNKYSRRHLFLNPDTDNAFWNFSFHEFGVKDLSAAIDFVLNKTGQSQLSIIGFSQGNQISYVLLSMMPEYNAKVKIVIALGPVAYLQNLPPPTSNLKLLQPYLDKFCEITGHDELFRKGSLMDIVEKYFCTEQTFWSEICEKRFVFPFAGPDPSEMDPEFFEIAMSHFPSSTSKKNFDHMVQLQYRRNFSLYDYGPVGNMVTYGSLESPVYPLNKITVPVVLFVGSNDRLADVRDAVLLSEELQNTVFHILRKKKMEHFDFIWGRDMDTYLFPVLFDLLENHPKIFYDGC